MSKSLIIAAIGVCLIIPDKPAQAGVLGESTRGAVSGAVVGSLLGGKKGRKRGARVGAVIGLASGVSNERQRRREAEQRAEMARRQAAWSEQQRLEEARISAQREQAMRAQEPDQMLVSETQRSLIRLGYDVGTVGMTNPQLEQAVRNYQRSAGLLETGQMSQELLRHMIANGG